MSHDLYLEILKYGKEKLNKELITKEMLFDYLKSKGFDISNSISPWLWSALDGSVFKHLSMSASNEFVLTPEAYFQLLEHERLEEARIDSKKSLKRSTIAIWISSILALLQVIIMIYEILFK